jgi:hypothetical protein
MQRARACKCRLVLHRCGRRTVGFCSGGVLFLLGRTGGCWSIRRGRHRGLGRLQCARYGLEAGVVGLRSHCGALSSNDSARGMLGAMRDDCAVLS